MKAFEIQMRYKKLINNNKLDKEKQKKGHNHLDYRLITF